MAHSADVSVEVFADLHADVGKAPHWDRQNETLTACRLDRRRSEQPNRRVGRRLHHRAADPHHELERHRLGDCVQPRRRQRQPTDIRIHRPRAPRFVWAAGNSGVPGSFNPLILQDG